MNNFLNNESQQMDEREFEDRLEMGEAVSIKDPISSLQMNKMVLVESGTTIEKVIELLQSNGVSCVLIVENDTLIGIFTERDVIKKLVGKNIDIAKEIVDNYMTYDPDTLHMDDPITFALNRMYDGGYRHVPIVESNNHPVGIVSILDIVSHLAVYYSDEVLNLPPNPARKAQKRREGG